jgi:hypothetical protein
MAFGRKPTYSLTAAMDNVVLHFRDDTPPANLGEGVSRPKRGDSVKEFTVRVRFPNAAPMKATLKARNKREALKFAGNRWPHSTCELEAV